MALRMPIEPPSYVIPRQGLLSVNDDDNDGDDKSEYDAFLRIHRASLLYINVGPPAHFSLPLRVNTRLINASRMLCQPGPQ